VQRSDPEQAQGAAVDTQSWSLKNVLALTFFVAFLTIQIIVPIVKLTAPRPSRFGWHMWAARKRNPQFILSMKDGTTSPVGLSTYLGISRGELDIHEAMPAHLCRVVPAVASVQIQTLDSERPKVYPCP
jgi:hypothetical protein